jgi:dihydroxyacetone kinase-like predicted kinase
MLEDSNNRATFIGKIIEIKNDNEFVVETLDKKNYIIVDITKDVVFEGGASKDFLLGNIVMFETIKSLMVTDYPLQHNVTRIIANNKDEVISIDIRETLSGYLGVFPDVVLDIDNREITVSEKDIVAISLKEIDTSYEYDKESELLMLISESQKRDYKEHYWAFLAIDKGVAKIDFYEDEGGKSKQIDFIINVK